MPGTVRIGSGAGYSGDRIDPAVELAVKGEIDYLVFECLAERTIALAQKSRLMNPEMGYDPLIEERMEAVLAICAQKKIRIISNMGAANPVAAAAKTREIAQRLGIPGIKTAAVTGDDVLAIVRARAIPFGDLEFPDVVPEELVSANAYLGAEPVIEALTAGADVILTGRVADPSMFLAPLVYEFGWPMDDWGKLGQGTVIGHLLECAGQLTGGYFADPGYKDIPNLAQLGFPIAEVSEDGGAVVTKVEGSGGAITEATCVEQLLYEIENPAAYITPDVVADFSQVRFREVSSNQIEVTGGRGKQRPETLKVSLGYLDGFVGEGQISYAGPGALARARLAEQILHERLKETGLSDLRFSLIGMNSIHGEHLSRHHDAPYEVRLRAVARSESMKSAAMVLREVEALYTNGPAGGGGVSGSTRETIGISSCLVPRTCVPYAIHYGES